MSPDRRARGARPRGGRGARAACMQPATLRAVVGLARREGLKGGSTQSISVQLAHLLLRWCCNTRDLHLLRAVPARLVGPAASRHDQSVKVACAAIMGFVDSAALREAQHLHGVVDASLDPRFLEAYEQVSLDVTLGDHGLRRWVAHTDAAFVGQWSLTCQSALVPNTRRSRER